MFERILLFFALDLRESQVSRETSVEAVPRLEAELDSPLDDCHEGTFAITPSVLKHL